MCIPGSPGRDGELRQVLDQPAARVLQALAADPPSCVHPFLVGAHATRSASTRFSIRNTFMHACMLRGSRYGDAYPHYIGCT